MGSKKSLQKDAPDVLQRQIFQELKELEEQKAKRGSGAAGAQAQIGKIEEGKGTRQDATGATVSR